MRAPHGGARHSGSVLVYSWQPVRELTGTDGARHAGMAQRLLQVVRSSCRLQLQVYYISGQAEVAAAPGGSPSRKRHIFVEGCRVAHFQGSTEAQYAHFLAHMGTTQPAPLLFCFLFYTGAWFPVEQRAIRNVTGWHRPESYLDEDAYDSGTGRKAGKLLHLLRAASRAPGTAWALRPSAGPHGPHQPRRSRDLGTPALLRRPPNVCACADGSQAPTTPASA